VPQPAGVPLPKTETERIQYGARALNIDLEKAAYVATEDAIEDPTGSLNSFFDSLTRTQQGKEGAVTRVLHYGDSIVVMDYITGQMRERMHSLFGDSGAGYMLLHRPSASYQRLDLGWKSGGGWKVESIMEVKPKPGDYSLGGFAFDGSEGAFAEYSLLKKKNQDGDPFSLIEVHYMARPSGGKFDIEVDGKKVTTVDTKADETMARVARLRVKDGAGTVRIAVEHGTPRLLGVVLERTRPGIVYDTMGILGARCLRLKEIRPDLLIAQLKERHPDLIVLNFGANESDDAGRSMAAVEADYSRLLALFRQALPKTSILVMGALDRGDKTGGKTVTKKNIPTIIMAQRAAALKNGCAFFNTFLAMGGDGTMARWNAMRPRLVSGDLIHPTEPGAAIVGDALYRAVMKSFLLRVADRVLNPNAPAPGTMPTTPTPLSPPSTTPNPTASHNPPTTAGEARKPSPPTAATTVPRATAMPVTSAALASRVKTEAKPERTERTERTEVRSEPKPEIKSVSKAEVPRRAQSPTAPIARPASRPVRADSPGTTVSATPRSIYE
jgi:lysophospholipase L1-like esterase